LLLGYHHNDHQLTFYSSEVLAGTVEQIATPSDIKASY